MPKAELIRVEIASQPLPGELICQSTAGGYPPVRPLYLNTNGKWQGAFDANVVDPIEKIIIHCNTNGGGSASRKMLVTQVTLIFSTAPTPTPIPTNTPTPTRTPTPTATPTNTATPTPTPSVPEPEQHFLTGECPICGTEEKNVMVGGPINTANGNYSYRQSGPTIAAVGSALRFEWSYNSLNSGVYPHLTERGSALGPGWNHNYDLKLEFPDSETILFQAAHGTPFKFARQGDGSWQGMPGVRASLTVSSDQYIIQAANQSRYRFNLSGQLVSQQDPQGNETSYSYDGSDRVSQVLDEGSGRYLDLSYDSLGGLVTVTDNGQRTIEFYYNSEGQLVSVSDTRGQVWQYDYRSVSGQSLLSRVTDPDGRMVEATDYDGYGRAISQTYRGEQLTIEYDDAKLERQVTDGLNRVTSHTYNDQLLLAGITDAAGISEIYSLDDNANRTYQQDKNGSATYYERTEWGQTTAITDALGNRTDYEYDSRNNLIRSVDALGNETIYDYDAQNNLIGTTDEQGNSQYRSYNAAGQLVSQTDANGNQTTYSYDALGQRISHTNAAGQTTSYVYDELGRLIETTDPLGKVTLNEYDGADNLIRVTENYWPTRPQNYQNEYNLITEYGYDGSGRRVTTTDTAGRVTRSVYDAAGRLAQSIQNEHPTVTTPNFQNEYNLITEYQYDAVGNQVAVIGPLGRESRTEYDDLNRVSRTIVNYVDGVYTPAVPDEDIITEYQYDANGNQVAVIDTLGNQTRTEYDDLNRVSRTIVNYQDGVYSDTYPDEDIITSYSYDANGNQETVTDVLGRVTSYEYDTLNRVVSISDPLGETTSYTYDAAGNRATVTDALGRVTSYSYDSLNRATVTDALGNQGVTHTYDAVGNRLSSTNAQGQTTLYEYDSLYRLIRQTNAAGETTTIEYDALGNRSRVIDAQGNSSQFEYDSLNRVVGTIDAQGNVTTMAYDALGNRMQTTDATGTETIYDYDRLNRLVRQESGYVAVTTVYDGLGNRRQVTNGAGETTTLSYDALNRLVSQQNSAGDTTWYQYDGAGQRLAMVDANGVETRYEYDAAGRLVAVTENYQQGVYDPAVPDADVTTHYEYDAVGNRLAVSDARGHETHYTYDALNRRVEQTDPLGQTTSYDYDILGNRISMTDPNGITTYYEYDELNRLLGIDYEDTTPDVFWAYDELGNRLSMVDGSGTTTYQYDSLSRLTEVTNGAGQVMGYGYDPLGQRTELIYPDNSVVNYDYDARHRLQTVTDWQGETISYSYDEADRLRQVSLANGVTTDYEYDAAGRLISLQHTNPLGAVMARYDYTLDGVGQRTQVVEQVVDLTGTVNMIANPGFEGGDLSGWELPYPGITIDAGSAHSGNYGVKLTERGRMDDTFETVPGAIYEVSAWVRLAEVVVPPTWGGLRLQVVDLPSWQQLGRSEFLHAGSHSGGQVVSLGEWVYVAFSFVAQGSTSRLIYQNFSDGRLTASADEFQVSQVGGVLQARQGRQTRPLGYRTYLPLVSRGGSSLGQQLLTWELACQVDECPPLPAELAQAYGVFESSPPPRLRRSGSSTQLRWRTISYEYDSLYRLTEADYSTGELYEYEYDAVGNRLQQVIDGDTTDYLYDAANRLESINGVSVSYDANGNLLTNSVMTNTWDSANRLISTLNQNVAMVNHYDGLGNRIGRTQDGVRIDYALDVAVGLPEVVFTSEGHKYLHLPGVIMTESDTGEVRYLLSDGLGSVRHVVDEAGTVVAYREYSPYGEPVAGDEAGYGFTGEWWESEVGLLHLRARWYDPGVGVFLSKDPIEKNHAYTYAENNPINLTDPTGLDTCAMYPDGNCPSPDELRARQVCRNVLGSKYDKQQCVQNALSIIQTPGTPEEFMYSTRQIPSMIIVGWALIIHDFDQACVDLIYKGVPSTIGLKGSADIGIDPFVFTGHDHGNSRSIAFNWYALEIGYLDGNDEHWGASTPQGGSMSVSIVPWGGYGASSLSRFGGPAYSSYLEVTADDIVEVGVVIEGGLAADGHRDNPLPPGYVSFYEFLPIEDWNYPNEYLIDPVTGGPVLQFGVGLTGGANAMPNGVDIRIGGSPGANHTEVSMLSGKKIFSQIAGAPIGDLLSYALNDIPYGYRNIIKQNLQTCKYILHCE